MVLPVGKDIEAGAVTGIIIPITDDLVYNHHKESVKAAAIITVISMPVDHPPQPDLSLNTTQSDIDVKHEEHSQYRVENEEDVQQGDGNHEDVGNVFT